MLDGLGGICQPTFCASWSPSLCGLRLRSQGVIRAKTSDCVAGARRADSWGIPELNGCMLKEVRSMYIVKSVRNKARKFGEVIRLNRESVFPYHIKSRLAQD